MAANKNQHFVPRCYLRPFSQNGEGRAISLFNLARKGAIDSAPVRGQCSGDYFYGEDLVLEKRLQAFEGLYATRLQSILESGYRLVEHDSDLLRAFWLLQYMRTDAAACALVGVFDSMDADLGGLPAGYNTTVKEAVQTAMRIFFTDMGIVADLTVRLIRNRTETPFITSDNPAVMTNRWHLTDPRTQIIGPGLQSGGMTAYLPLSPSVACILYDRDLYSMSHECGWADAVREADVDAINEHQVLNCQTNLYFRPWTARDRVADLVARVGGGRPPARYKLNYAVLDRMDGRTKTYRQVDAEESRKHEDAIVHTALVSPTPSRWPSLIGWRPGGFVYRSTTGSAFVRKHTRDPNFFYNKIKIRP